MASTPIERERRLAGWLEALVQLLLAEGGPVRTALIATTLGKTAVVQLDDVRLRLTALPDPEGIALDITRPEAGALPSFRCDAQSLRDIISGRRLLDALVVEDRLYVRAPLADLLAMYDLVLKSLASGPIHPSLRALWSEFDNGWPQGESPPCSCLDGQRPHYGQLRKGIPEAVLRVDLKATGDHESGHSG